MPDISSAISKPRLLIIINRFVIGGQASDTIPLLYHLRDSYLINVLYGEKEADEIEPLFLLQEYPGITLEKVPSLKRTVNPFADLVTLFRLFKLIKRWRPHIVHTHGAKSGLLGRVAAWIARVPVIVHTFHGHLFHSYFNRITTSLILFVEKSLSYITDAAIALSQSQKDEIGNKFAVYPLHKIHVIPLGMDQTAPTANSNFRKSYNLSQDEVAIAIIGRLVPIKNHHDFLKIAEKISSECSDKLRFFVIGDGSERRGLEQFLKSNSILYSTPEAPHLNAKIIFTSWQSNVLEVMNGLDIVVLTSLNEGTPVSLIEAQLCGKPVVAYDVGGVKDTFVNNVSGYLVAKGDIEGFCARLKKLIKDKTLREQMGREGKEYCSRRFSKQAEVNAVDKLYSGLLLKKAVQVS